jgi:predicted ATP-dependent serine protease
MAASIADVKPRHLTIVRMKPREGKTKALLEMSSQLAELGKTVFFYSFEESPDTLRMKMKRWEIKDRSNISIWYYVWKVGALREVIDTCRATRPDILVLDGFPAQVTHFRILSEAARELGIPIVTSQTVQKNMQPMA